MKNVLTLFNGISALHLALDKAGIKHGQVYYAEIDKYANKVTEKHYPNDIALGDVTKWREWDIDWSEIGLVGAGFPCQAWSVAGKQLGDKDERGMLFWTTLEIIAHVLKHNPSAKFLMENVKMKKEFEEYITHHTEQALGHVEKTLINSALVSAQNRQRYYWTNFEVSQPEDKGILLRDVLEYPMDDKYKLSDEAIARFKPCQKTNSGQVGTTAYEGKIGQRDRVYDADGKMVTLTATIYKQPPQYAVSGIKKVTNVNPSGRGMNGNVYDANSDKSPTLTTNKGEGIKITVATIRPASIVGRRLNERGVRDDYNKDVAITQCLQVKHKSDKTGCLTTVDKDNVLSTEPPGRYPDIYNRGDISYRKLTPLECERLQTFPDNWTDCISNTQRYKSLGNAWTVDVIAHIFKCMA
ncbi:DNA (cytosine-5-)-methyltransferase [Jeotgalibaca porci]|uniref:DNA (cytosine-5-)-methyltransferase n=1 Tax=Jeotgalibaca porci TaxID=1868793 RepID=UPI00359F1B8D